MHIVDLIDIPVYWRIKVKLKPLKPIKQVAKYKVPRLGKSLLAAGF